MLMSIVETMVSVYQHTEQAPLHLYNIYNRDVAPTLLYVKEEQHHLTERTNDGVGTSQRRHRAKS